jgi:hypothetical protein
MQDRAKRRKRGVCPVCLEKLSRISSGTRFARQCEHCNAVEQRSHHCTSCGNDRLWRGPRGVACNRCGKAAPNIEGADWILRRELFSEPNLREKLCLEFPEIADNVREYTGLVYLQFSELAQLTNKAISGRDTDLLARSFSFVEELAKRRNELHLEILNALSVSYLEHLDVDSENRSWALEAMPPILRHWRRQVLAYLDKLLGES